MATYVPAKRATEFIFYMGLVSQSTGQFQENPTLAAGDCKVSKDGGALANLATLPAVTPAGSKMVKVTLSSTEMTADNVTLVFSDAAGAEWDDVIVNIQTAANQIDDLATQASVNTIDDFLDTEIAAILADTNELQTDWANGGRLDLILDAIETDTQDIQSRLPAALVSGRIDASVGAMATDTLTASALAADAVTEIQSGLSTLTAAQVNAEADTALSDYGALKPTVAGRTLDVSAGGEAGVDWANIGSPTTTVNLSGTTVKTVSDLAGVPGGVVNIQTRIPGALSPNGNIKADIKEIEDELTSGYNATLKLRQLDITNDAGTALIARSTGGNGSGAYFVGDGTGYGVDIAGGANQNGLQIDGGNSAGSAVNINSHAAGFYAISVLSDDGPGIYVEGINGNGIDVFSSAKSINAPQDIAVSDGSLTLAAIASAVWSAATRTLTAISDSAGITTLLSRIASALNISGGKVESNVKQINDADVTGNGTSGDPWRPL